MGDLTRSELVEEVRKNLGDRPSTIDTRIIRHLNLAQTRIARRHRFSSLNRTDSVTIPVSGTPSTDKFHEFSGLVVRSIHSLVRVNTGERPVKLIGKPARQWAQLVGVSEEYALGDPTHYHEWQRGKIEFWRVPNRSFTLVRKYRVWPSPLDSDGKKSDLNYVDDALIAFATSSFFRSLGMRDDAGEYFAIGRALLDDAIIQDQENPDESTVFEDVSESEVLTGRYVDDPFIRRSP